MISLYGTMSGMAYSVAKEIPMYIILIYDLLLTLNPFYKYEAMIEWLREPVHGSGKGASLRIYVAI